jgi:hypothetical protein
MGFKTEPLGAPSSVNAIMLISLAQDNFFVSLLLLSAGSKPEFKALWNSRKELKPVLDRLASSPVFGLVDGSSLTTLLTEIDKLPLTATDLVVIFGVLTRRGCSGRDVATAVMLIDPAERREYYGPSISPST